jgi:hypothetical protein
LITIMLSGRQSADPYAFRRLRQYRWQQLAALRDNWLDPPDLVDLVPEVVPGHPDSIVARPGKEAELKMRTLTNLYNARPAWLALAHRDLDRAVAAADGWEESRAEPENPDAADRKAAEEESCAACSR